MSPGLEFLERCAGDTGFRIPALEKVVRLGEVLAAVARHPLLGASLALKGGTALGLAFGEPTRLSVDLDFNYIVGGEVESASLLSSHPAIQWRMKNIREYLKKPRTQRPADGEVRGRRSTTG